jgi:hypothetical protein
VLSAMPRAGAPKHGVRSLPPRGYPRRTGPDTLAALGSPVTPAEPSPGAPRSEAACVFVPVGVHMLDEPTSLRPRAAHIIKLRDLRRRYGEPEAFAAQCSCGWTGETRHGHAADRDARQDGRRHEQHERAGG